MGKRLILVFVAFLALAAACSGGDEPPPDTGTVDPCIADPSLPECAMAACADDPCPEGERCVPDGASYVCDCAAGFERTDEGCVEILGCDDRTCDGHGVCSDDGGMIACECDLGHAGPRCGMCDEPAGYLRNTDGECVTDLCDPSPCDDPARMRCEVVDGSATCACNAGTHDDGGLCVPDETCSETTCSMRGTCSETPDGVACMCEVGATGAFCERCDDLAGYHDDGMGGCTMDVCLPNPCTEPLESVCSVAPDGAAVCDCDPGAHREDGACVADEVCEATTCASTGTCAVVDGRTLCTCDSGFAGARCDECDAGYHDDGAGGCTMDICLPNPCTAPNQTICRDDAGRAVCDCDPGFHDDGVGGCTDDPCTPDPCAASGQACRVTAGMAECYTPTCDDGNPCTSDAFTGGRCVFTPFADGTACSTTLCTAGQTCGGGACGGGTTVVCDDGNACTRDSCDATTGCAAVADDTLIPDDGIACTVDACSGGTESHGASDALCSDGLFCNGAETCAPSDPLAAVDGCVTGATPVPPGVSIPCRSYGACDERTDSFPLTTIAAGGACDDGSSCTTGDVCDAAGLCRGTALATCPGTCSTTTTFGSAVDIAVGRVTGAITVDGAALPATVPYGTSGFRLFLVHRDTDQRHYIATPGYGYLSSTTYQLVAGSDVVDAALVPGVYDLVYSRGHDDGSDSQWPYVSRTDATNTFPNGYVVLRRGVVIAAGTQTLDVDVPIARLTGAVTVGGAPLPATVPYGTSGFRVFLRQQETGQRHYISSPGYGYLSSSTYQLVAGSDAVDAALVPGVYDLIYSRGHDDGSASQWSYVSRTDSTNVFPNGYLVLRSDITVSAGAGTLNVDVPVSRLTGAITVDGAALPATVPYGTSGFRIFAVNRETEQRHYIATPGYGYLSSTTYQLVAGSDAVNAALVPGSYDVVYSRGHDDGSASQWPYVSRTDSGNVFPNGYVVLQSNVTVSGGASTLNVDVPLGRVTGAITVGGAPLPATVPYGTSGFRLFLVDQQTGQRHYVATPGYGYLSSTTYQLVAGSDAVNAALPPSTYDLVYSRGHDDGSASQWPYVSRTGSTNVFPNGYVVLSRGITVAAGANTLNVDVPVSRLTGSITVAGAALPATVPYGTSGFRLFLVHRDTGQRHYIATPGYGYLSSTTYQLTAGSDVVDAALVPGVYDLIYSRGHDDGSDSQWPYVSRTDSMNVFPNGYVVVRSSITLSAGASTLDVDVPTSRHYGAVTVEGLPLPATVPYGTSGFRIFLVARSTEQRHYISTPGYGYLSSTTYQLVAGSDAVNSTLVPGTYDVIYSRGHDDGSASQWPYVSRTDSTNVFPNGYATTVGCVDLR